MAAVMGPGSGFGVPGAKRTRRWLLAVVAGWVVVLAGVSWWSVRNDPATVPEQRDAGQAMAPLRKAAGTLLAAAENGPWVIRLGAPHVETCRLTPVRDGRRAGQDVFLYVPQGQAEAALDQVAAALPGDYRAGVVPTKAGTRLALYADAGDFIAVEAHAEPADQVLTLSADTGCRPPGVTTAATGPAAGPAPATLTETVVALGGTAAAEVSVESAGCPEGGVAATYRATAGASGDRPVGVPAGTTVVWSSAGGWAYRKGSASVVVDANGERLQVAVTTACES
ncbi:hypothetical protein Apa02nite_070680 [Actinoplanes palleronii]|uniref:Uncharacterized protein n=1 Tax=Actinoplanes palleronii TaxID=113570 RepID=A0ABQ4BL33_9ACTN|nr:hypothetical protein Apa02nite_070680 [Actinoplanes palleronii]